MLQMSPAEHTDRRGPQAGASVRPVSIAAAMAVFAGGCSIASDLARVWPRLSVPDGIQASQAGARRYVVVRPAASPARPEPIRTRPLSGTAHDRGSGSEANRDATVRA